MSRIGKLPIKLPKGVQVDISPENLVTIKGGMGELSQQVHPSISIRIEGEELLVNRKSDEKQERAYHGLYRSLLSNMVQGVSVGYTVNLELVGVGYRCVATGQLLELALGYSHNFVIELPTEIKVETLTEKGQNPKIILKSHDKQLIGQVAAKIRSYRMPEPYKGKGVKFTGEVIRRKAGKAASAK